MSSVDQRLAQLEERLRAAEDRLAIVDLVASYGPLVDRGDAHGAAALWLQEGVYDVDTGTYVGRAGIAAMVASPQHQGLIARGCAHVTSAPRIELQGDRAVAVTHSQLLVRNDAGSFDVLRATAHRWELVRSPEGWRIERRTARVIDGDEAARALLTPP